MPPISGSQSPSFVPAQGETVLYVLPRSPRKKRPAIITRIRNSGALDLCVLTTAVNRGRFHRRASTFNVRGVKRDLTGTVGGTWHPRPAGDPNHVIADYVAPAANPASAPANATAETTG